jgi:molybdenum cofactor cytidylyltransferase
MIGAIILAAGSSRRFGDDKRKAILNEGDSVLVRTINNVASILGNTLVVLRFGDRQYADELAKLIDQPNVSYFLAPDSAKGMAHSLSNAIHTVSDLDAIMVFLADMPYIQPDTVNKLLTALDTHEGEAPIIVPTLNGTPGHPVIFDQAYFEELQALEGDRGARSVVDAHQDNLVLVEVDDPGVLKDIDTPNDL